VSATEEPKAAHVIEALCRVMRDLPSIEKGGQADPKQGGYRYRGIDQITPHTQELFARHGVLFTPRVISFDLRELMVNAKPWTDVVEEIEYDVYGPGGIEDKIVIGPILAIGRDNSDKGGNKCLTQAMKYALLQTFQISDPVDDADGTTHEADARSAEPAAAKAQIVAVKQAIAGLTAEQWPPLQEWSRKQNLPEPDRLTAKQAEAALAYLAELTATDDGSGPTVAGPGPDPAPTGFDAEAKYMADHAEKGAK